MAVRKRLRRRNLLTNVLRALHARVLTGKMSAPHRRFRLFSTRQSTVGHPTRGVLATRRVVHRPHRAQQPGPRVPTMLATPRIVQRTKPRVSAGDLWRLVPACALAHAASAAAHGRPVSDGVAHRGGSTVENKVLRHTSSFGSGRLLPESSGTHLARRIRVSQLQSDDPPTGQMTQIQYGPHARPRGVREDRRRWSDRRAPRDPHHAGRQLDIPGVASHDQAASVRRKHRSAPDRRCRLVRWTVSASG